MLTTRFASSVPRPFANDSAGFDYFSTDFHYMNVAAEIRRQLLQQRGFLLLNGPPSPDGKLLERYLDGSTAADASDAAPFRANLVRCRDGWTFGDVVIAYSRELGLSPDAGAWSILSQVMQESRKGLTRVLILDNAEVLDDGGFDELRRFTRVDDPYILPVVLLAGPGFAERLELDLRSVKPSIVGSLPLQHLMPAEVAAFVRYQVEPIGESVEEAFTPGAVATIAEAAEGDPSVVNQLARQHLDAFAGPRAPVAPVEARLEHENLPVATDRIPAAEVFSPRAAEPLPEPLFARPTDSAATVEIEPLPRPRRRAERLARNLTVAAALLFVGVYGIAFLYSFVPESSSDGAAQPAAPVASAVPVPPPPAPAADRSAAEPPATPEKRVVSAEPRQPLAPQDAARSLEAAAQQAAGIEPSAAAPQTPAPAAPAPPPAAVARPEPVPPAPETVARAEPAAPPPAAAPAPPAPQTVARAEPAAPPPAAQLKPVTRAELQPVPRTAQAGESPPASDASALVERGDRLLAAGDIASAREFFERAVENGDPAASYGLGKSYDPLFLQQIAQQGVAGDATKAAAWYRRAVASGNVEAAKRLTQLLAKYPPGTTGQGSSR
jgi:hypothetical protein